MATSDWQPSASISALKHRAQLLDKVRYFFKSRDYLEVETPIMARHGITDVYLSNMKARFRNQDYCLQTSPEYHMKRLLAADSGPIFQITKVFRDDELGRWHNPEFSLLEWYRPGIDHLQLLDEMEELLAEILGVPGLIRKTYAQAFQEACQLNPHQASIAEFKQVLQQHDLSGVLPDDEMDRDQYLFLLMSHVVEPYFGHADRPVAVYDFPESQAALAQVHQGFAERFEIYYRGVELANGFHELTQVQAQAQRFAEDLQLRQAKGLEQPVIDSWLLAALEHGLPPCSGVALGLDRLFALALEKQSLSEILSFDFSRA